MAEDEDIDDSPEDLPDAKADDGPLTSADFHTIAQKQILNAVFAVLAESKMDWELIAPFLEAARELAVADFAETGRVRLHNLRAEGEAWVEAEEAFLGISVSDREDGREWLSETYWLSDVATADEDPEQVRAILRALERSVDKIKAWLADKPGGAVAAPPAHES